MMRCTCNVAHLQPCRVHPPGYNFATPADPRDAELERLRTEAERLHDGLTDAAADLQTLGNCIAGAAPKWANFATEAAVRSRAVLAGGADRPATGTACGGVPDPDEGAG